MIKTLRSLIKREDGTVVVLVAIGITVFLGFTAMVADAGMLYMERSKLVQAMDAAALAGVQELPDNPSAAVQKAQEYAQKNGVNPADLTITVGVDNKDISIGTTKQVNLAFARVLGFNVSNVEAKAKAAVAPAKTVSRFIPMSVLDQPLVVGSEYKLKSADKVGTYNNGWRGILDFTGGGGGANEYREMTRNGYPGQLTVGQVVEKEMGNKSGPTVQGVEDRIAACTRTPACTYNDYEPGCPRLVWVPVVVEVDQSHVRVVGFAAFFIQRVDGNGNNNNVWGTFVKETISAETDPAAADYGLYGAKLTN